jgi:stearoyl-CoA desaturase (delta-9 desaturase)
MIEATQSTAELVVLWVFVVAPFVALLAAVPLVWGWGLSGLDVTMALVGYLVAIAGVTVGFHRHLTHGSFKARRGLRIALAVAGCLAIEGAPTKWVADHRRHHAFTDRRGDPHSPWRYGTGVRALAKGLLYRALRVAAQPGGHEQVPVRAGPARRPGIRVVDRLFIPLIVMSLLAPAVVGGLVTGSWVGALTGFFWAGLVRMALLHHVTWSVNSICHVVGERPFASKDKATNFWPLAILSFGESLAQLAPCRPDSGPATAFCAVRSTPGARLIWLFERAGWVRDVRWPTGAPCRQTRPRVSRAGLPSTTLPAVGTPPWRSHLPRNRYKETP